MITVKEQLRQAQLLLQARKYPQARRLLVAIDHPKAAQWLEKLDRIDPLPPVAARGLFGWLRDHLLIAAVLGLVILVALWLVVIIAGGGRASEACDATTVTVWWQGQDELIAAFLGDLEMMLLAEPGPLFDQFFDQMRQSKDMSSAAPVPECADARIFGGYQQVLRNMDMALNASEGRQNGALSPVTYGDRLRVARSGITAGKGAIRAALG